MTDRAESMARYMWEARCKRQRFANLPEPLVPASIDEAYAAQEAYWRFAEPVYGPVAGVKVATTTKVMQQLMGITHPCGGAIFSKTIHASGARISMADFVNLRIESEMALKIGADMPVSRAPWTAESVVRHVASALVAYELIDDRNAVYAETKAASLIADNCWNGGVVLGPGKAVAPSDVVGAQGRQAINGQRAHEGRAEDPFATLAWLANLMAHRGHGLASGMVVITGSIVPTFSVSRGDHLRFSVDGLGEVEMDVA